MVLIIIKPGIICAQYQDVKFKLKKTIIGKILNNNQSLNLIQK